MRTVWKGTLSFGLVSVPVGLVVAQERQPVRFRRVSRRTGAPVRHRRWDPVEDRELSHEETMPALELGAGHYATVEPEELRALRAGGPAAPRPPSPEPAERGAFEPEPDELDPGEPEPQADPIASRPAPEPHTIAVEGFVPLADVPGELYDKAYWLAPEPMGRRPYRLLLAALEEAGQAAICRFVLREREHLALVRSDGDVMVLQTLHWPEDIRSGDRERIAAGVAEAPLEEPELALARQLVGMMERPFAADEHRDAARARVLAYLATRGAPAPAPAAEEPRQVPDLLAALKASIAAARAEDGEERAAG
ncbi:MAG: end-binding protein Ku [Miltoncostaeaceae bacterium]|jgi:DNA end-binding protein Ku|nr:end-binding protein Ku [Miltoncostaeaceae bacterium]